MPQIELDGVTHYVPGVYIATRVESSLTGPTPAFHIPVLLGAGWDGHPYDVVSKQVAGEARLSPLKRINTEGQCADYFGREQPLHRGFRVAKRHGLPFAYVVNLSDMVRASIIAETSGNVSEFVLYPKKWGPMGGWPKVSLNAGVWATTPVKRYAQIAANVGSSAVRIYTVGNHPWITIGATVHIGSNAVAGVDKTVTNVGSEINSSGQRAYWFEVNTTVGSALNTSDYAVVLQYDTGAVETSPAHATCQALIDWLNTTSKHWTAVATAAAALPATVATATAIKDLGSTWGTFTAGTAPAPTDTELADFVSVMNAGEWARFVVDQGVLPRAYCLLSSDATMHATMRDYAIAERARGEQYAISVTTGCAWGDVVVGAGDTTAPEYRAATLNSQEVDLCANGGDREAAFLSMAPAVWGRLVAGGVGHNLTNDELLFSEYETEWNEIEDSELSTLCRRGVVTNKLSIALPPRYRLSQGTSTLQANTVIWNPSDKTTWSRQQRDLADGTNRVLAQVFEEFEIGGDKVDRNGIAQMLQRTKKQLQRLGWILGTDDGLTVTSIEINSAGNGYDVALAVRHPNTVDFIAFTVTVLIGEE